MQQPLQISQSAHEDVYVAIHDAFDAAVRQVEDHGHCMHRDTKTHAP